MARSKKDKLVHPLARRCAVNAWLMLKAQDRFKNPHQLGVAAEHSGYAAKNTIRNIFFPEARPLGKHDQPTAPTLDSLEAAAKALGVELHDFLDPNLTDTKRMRIELAVLKRFIAQLYSACPGLFVYINPWKTKEELDELMHMETLQQPPSEAPADTAAPALFETHR